MQAVQKHITSDDDSATPATADLAAQPAMAEARLAAREARLTDAEQMLGDALQSSLSWLWEADENLCFTRMVGPIEQIYGIPVEKFVGRPIEDVARRSDDLSIQQYLDALHNHKTYRDVVNPISTRLGRRWVKTSGKPLFDAEGRFLGYRGIGSDVTTQVETEHRLAAVQRRFMEALENVPSSILLCDAEDRIVFCNSATQRYFPTSSHLLIPGTKFEDLLRAHAVSYVKGIGENFEGWIAERMKSHRTGSTNVTRAYQDGRWSQIIERRTSDGGIIAMRLDITELKKSEQEFQRSNAELEQFAYVASHDLQEPLRMVASYCQLLQRRYKDKLEADANEFIGYAVEGANRMQRLINDLLSYSRVGRKGGSPETFPAADAVKTALTNLQGAISDSGAKVEFDTLPAIHADRTQIGQLFQNLIGNAIKFRRDGVAPHISITAAPENDLWRFTVADNGIGIEKEYLDRVFLIFQRLHERNKYPGTGIGLAIAKKVIEHHGGRIWIDSTPGQGSRFNFTLPTAA